MSEAELQAAVVELAKWNGWLCFHVIDSRKSIGVGFPDLVLVHRTTGRVLFRELKTDSGRVRPQQAEWLEALSKTHDAGIWRPVDWHDGAIRGELAERSVAA